MTRVLLIWFLAALAADAAPVSFSRDVLPLLSDNCLACHGQDEGHRKADLRLDTPEGAREVLQSGDFIARITSDDPDEIMPPPKSHKPKLSAEQIETLKRWIAEGSKWGKHWAFEKPVKGPTEGHPVDFFVKARLAKENRQLSPKAPEHTLRRRLAFDLTGLPPSPSKSTDLESEITNLLASPHFGERMAMWWLDAARYSDTDGFQSDATRTNWAWRDYVVESFNANKPFDQFTLEQFAGDLLPNATPEQKIATCFHRNHMTNGEGGRDKEESRIDYVIDRVNTMGTVWLGMTLGCVQCHAHKFDPISHEDYYRLFAFFNGIDEDGKAGGGAKPFLKYRSDHAAGAVAEAQVWAELQTARQAATNRRVMADYPAWFAKQVELVAGGFSPWRVGESRGVRSVEGTEMFASSDGVYFTGGP
jgi:hypothetical protein